jgi:hypothetical protein
MPSSRAANRPTASPEPQPATVAGDHLTEINRKLTELSAMRRTLSQLVDCCAGDGRRDCPILDGLAAPSLLKP